MSGLRQSNHHFSSSLCHPPGTRRRVSLTRDNVQGDAANAGPPTMTRRPSIIREVESSSTVVCDSEKAVEIE